MLFTLGNEPSDRRILLDMPLLSRDRHFDDAPELKSLGW
jgi:hypothetical protein